MVAGGTGFVGRALTHALLARGERVQILTRGPAGLVSHSCRECGAGGRLELVHWTPDRPGAWTSAVEGADAVVNLAGAGVAEERWTSDRRDDLRESRLVSTRLLAEAIARAEQKPRVFVSASAVTYYGRHTGDRLLGDDEPPGSDFLAQLAVDWEAAAAGSGVRTCHARLGLVLGRGGGLYEWLASLFKAYMGGPLGDGAQYVSWVHLRDAVRALEAMIDRPDLAGAYNVVSPEPVSMAELAAACGEAFGRPALFRMPWFALKLALGAGAVEARLAGQRAVPKRLVDAGFAFVFPDVRSALVDLVQSPRSRPLVAS